ncbi:MAG: hypothetical protein WC870_03050 [Candidatus Paceibacterota bacterium]
MNKDMNIKKYMEDSEFFIIWAYLNGKRILGKNNLCFYDLAGIEKNKSLVAVFLHYKLEELGVKNIQGLEFDNEIYDRFSTTEHQKMLETMQEYNLVDINKSFYLILENKFNLTDIVRVSRQFPNMIDYFSFDSGLKEKTKKIIEIYIKKYIKDFIEDKLSIEDKNYWLFEKQKKATVNALSARQEKYGDDFIIEYPTQKYSGAVIKNEEYLFIHTLSALENLEYLCIEKIWIDQYTERDKEKFYKVKLHLNKKFSEAQRNQNISKLDQTEVRKSKLFFNEKSKQLCNSNGKKSQIIKLGPLRLLKCFLKKKETLKCKKDEIIRTMGGQDQYSGARRQLLSLINEVADIDSIHSKDNKKIVEYYQLRAL